MHFTAKPLQPEDKPVDTVSDVDPTVLHDDDRSAWMALDGGQHGDRVRSRAFGKLTLARVLVHAGRPDEAAAHGRAVCAVAPSLSSVRVHRQLTGLGAALHRCVRVDRQHHSSGATIAHNYGHDGAGVSLS